jgi:rubrerythrin
MQDIFKFAMKMEMDGKAYYEKHALRTDDPRLKEILSTLAEEEQRHFEVFRSLMNDAGDTAAGEKLTGGETLKKVQNIFEQLAENKETESFGDDAIAVWTEALRTEEKSEAFYKEKASEDSDEIRQKLFLRIAQEENNHIKMIDGILMFLKDPATFAQSAQFRNFRSLEGH